MAMLTYKTWKKNSRYSMNNNCVLFSREKPLINFPASLQFWVSADRGL